MKSQLPLIQSIILIFCISKNEYLYFAVILTNDSATRWATAMDFWIV